MSEFVKSFDISPSAVAAAGPGGQVTADIAIPAAAKRWTLLVVPKDTGTATAGPAVELQYAINGEFFVIDPPGPPTSIALNELAIITREDVVSRVRLIFDLPGGTLFNGGIQIHLNIVR